ncbi:hypothetical protein GWK47_024558 [Chionoecetes opilio]|uniref:Uncharacterized protein n=1 Tax=Chionoecetes opilio TaxID=41210 RepID=A0A8J4XVC2_CHIOP|nr:hypothetical protein GWK47_024558 [Chionoecetes opilio]
MGASSGLRGNKTKRKGVRKKKDAAAGGDDIIGDIFADVPRETAPRRVPEPGSVVAREWLLLKNTELQEEPRSPPSKATRERSNSCSIRPCLDPASPPSLVPVRRKDSRLAKSNRTKDANGNRIGKGLRGPGVQENSHVEVHKEVAARDHRSTATEEHEEAPMASDVTLIRVQPPPEATGAAPGVDGPSRIPRKGSLHVTPEVTFEEDKDKHSGGSISPGVKRHSSSRSTGSEGSTLRRRRRGTARSSAATQTPTGSHSDLPDCTIPPDKRASFRNHETPPSQPEEPHPRKDLTGSIPGASLLMKLMMPREKRSSKHSGGSPTRDGNQHGSVQPSGRNPSSPPMPWFWPPLRHLEAMTSLHSVFPTTKGPPPQSTPVCHGVAAGGGEAEAPGNMGLFPGDVVPFPPRAAPPVPCQVQGDQLSLSSLNSSLAGHTYEQVNFIIEPPICEYRESEYELSKSISEDIHSYHIDKEDVMPKESYLVPRRSSDSRVAEVAERSRTRRTSRRKRKKSRCAATITDECLLGDIIPEVLLCPEEQVSKGTRLLSQSEEDEVILSVPVTPSLSPAVSVGHRDLRWSSTTCSSNSSALGERHIATLEKPITLVSETTLELGRSPSVSPPLPERQVRGVSPQTSSDPLATKDAAFIHRLLTLVKEDGAQSSGSGSPGPPDTRHNARRRGVYVPLDTESDTGVTSEPEPSRGPRVTPSPDPRSEGDIQWPRRTSLASSMGDRLLCPVHGACSPHQASLAAASQRRRLRRASLPVPVATEPRPSFFQRLRRSLRRSRNVEPLIAELPSPADMHGVEDVIPTVGPEDLLPPPGVTCCCPDPVEEFRRFRPRLGSVVTVGSSDEDDRRPRPPTPQDACERWRVEGEVCRLQEALGQRLGSTAMIMRRRDHRLHTINTIEKTIQKLQQDTLRTQHNNQVNCNEQDSQRASSPQAHHPTDIMDAVNANQVRATPAVCVREEDENLC